MTLTKLRKEMKGMANKLLRNTQHFTNHYDIDFDIIDGYYEIRTKEDFDLIMMYNADSKNKGSLPYLMINDKNYMYSAGIDYKKQPYFFKQKDFGSNHIYINHEDFVEAYNRVSEAHK